MMLKPFIVVVAALALASCQESQDSLQVTISGGAVSGLALEDSAVRVFKGIPFAAPPVNDLRWRPPMEVEPWAGVYSATSFGPACMQSLREEGSFFGQIVEEMDEDCLYLNVWSAAESEQQLPVMVWIHGGGLSSGHGAEATYDGSALAERGVVLVTINYRLGPFGYLTHPLLAQESVHQASGNYGTLDQIAALQWVQDNISTFGGDPNRVTIFGESAGSWSVNHLMATPLAANLFHRAIGESGGGFGSFGKAFPKGHMEVSGLELGQTLIGAQAVTSAAQLRAVSAEDIMALPRGPLGTSPNIDGWVFPDSIYNIFANGQQNDVPLIVGSNADEWATLRIGTSSTLSAYNQSAINVYGALVDQYLSIYPADSDAAATAASIAALTDQNFGWEARTWARMMDTVSSDAYYYFFSRVPPSPDSTTNGSFHTAEIAYVFDNFGKSPFTYANQHYDEVDRGLSDLMASYWVNFASTGNPNDNDLPKWPVFERESDRALEFGDTVKERSGIRKARLDFMDAYYRRQRH